MIYQKLFLTKGRKLRWRKHVDAKARKEETELRTPQLIYVHCSLRPMFVFDIEAQKICFQN